MNIDDDLRSSFDEAWYLSQNTDVVLIKDGGHWESGFQHYIMHGRSEGRLPHPMKFDLEEVYDKHNGVGFLNPTDLRVTDLPLKRVALIGSCLMSAWQFHVKNPANCEVDLITVNNADDLPELSEGVSPAEHYDFQVIQIALRSILPDEALAKTPYDSAEAFQQILDDVLDRLSFQLSSRMKWNSQYGLLTFVSNFFVPQRNPMGLFFPKYDLRNPEYFFDRINQHLETLVLSYKNAFILDIDRLSASLGRRYCQDDSITHYSHGALFFTTGSIATRMEPLASMMDHYEVRWPAIFRDALWSEIVAMYRTIRQTDAVKLVVVDLDDTLWNGISGEMSDIDPEMIEGWPLGLVEALLYLKQRGVLLAIISKNEESRVRKIWRTIFGERISLEDFAAIYINWNPKVESMRDLLENVNLLPRSVVFIDDNPGERAAMRNAFPEMRILGRHPYYLRRTLLWSSETQVAALTKESSRRTEMIQAQLERESTRKTLTRGDFLKKASPRVRISAIQDVNHQKFPRAFELINKTNQFNTTGIRWTNEQVSAFFSAGGSLLVFEVTDNFTDYGLVGVVLLKDNSIEQWVMSCRILGYEIENAVMAIIAELIKERGHANISAVLRETDVNFPCRNLYANSGFARDRDLWTLNLEKGLAIPDHVKILSDSILET